MSETQGLCESCKELKAVGHTDVYGREFCVDCAPMVTVSGPPIEILSLLATIPFHVGDKVEARTGGTLYDGVGHIEEVNIGFDEDGNVSLEKFGTPVYPSFRVVFDEKAYDEVPDEVWYMEQQLKLVPSA